MDDDPAEVGGYRLIGRLGAGGQGTVYLAEPAQGGARVAIKCLSAESLDDSGVRQRFVREAETARKVASFCTAAVMAADFDAASPYIVSEYVEGPSLSQRIRQDGPMTDGDLSRLAVATATALVAIHEAGIVHRDFKPGNVLLGDGGARVIDFGIAQITEGAGTLTNSTIGTPAFMAPEQIAHGNATAASDVFAWGAVLAFAATGTSPFQGSTIPNVLHNVLNTAPDLSALPATLRPLVASALAKDPAARPNTVEVLMTLLGRQGGPTDATSLDQAMRDAHTAVLDGTAATAAIRPPTPGTLPEPNPSGRSGRLKRTPRWLLGTGAVLVAAAFAGMGMLLGNVLEGGTSAEEKGGDENKSGGGGTGGNGNDAAGTRFSEDEAGSWEGTTDSGIQVEVRTEAGEPTAELKALGEDNCSAQIRLLDDTDNTDRAYISFTEGQVRPCMSNESWNYSSEVDLTVNGDTMTIDIFAENSVSGERMTGSGPKTTVVLSRTD
ncbi:serine/threonine-protein kinase [Nocardiopsis sp. CNT-189]|uniref:serine/threonine-protein kinase n=1 Tax=Nocardiopsis oceanisediminis TaxID=2816862 RepID=UPI003B3ABA96